MSLPDTRSRVALLDPPFPREEWDCPSVPALRLGWTMYDDRDPGRDACTLAGELGRHLTRPGFFLRQAHKTDCVVLVDRDTLPACPVVADGILTNRRDLLVGVSVADCLPLYLVSPAAVAVLHAGWRGVLGGILSVSMYRLRDEFGVKAGELELYIGPGIGPCCFEVSPAVWSLFPSECRTLRAGSYYLDLALAVTRQWLHSGSRSLVHRLDRCTVCSRPTLHSYRRDGGHGRNFAYLYYAREPSKNR